MSLVARIWRGTTRADAAIERFAGPDVERAVYYPEDDDYLLEREPKVEHWQAELRLPR